MFALVVHLDRNSQFYSIVKQQASEIMFQKKTRHGAGENSVDSHPYLTSLPSYFLCVCVCSSTGSEEEMGGNSRQRQGYSRHGSAGVPGSLEKRLDELERVGYQQEHDFMTCLYFIPFISIYYNTDCIQLI